MGDRRVRQDIEADAVAVKVLIGADDKFGAAVRNDTVKGDIGVLTIPTEEASVDVAIELLIGGLNDDASGIVALRHCAGGDARIGYGDLLTGGQFTRVRGLRPGLCRGLRGGAQLRSLGVIEFLRDPPRRAVLRGIDSLDCCVFRAEELVKVCLAVRDGEVGEEVAVDKQCERAVATAGEIDRGEVLVTVLVLILLWRNTELVVLGGGIARCCLVEALTEGGGGFLHWTFATDLNGSCYRFGGNELSVLVTGSGAVGELVASGLGKDRVVVSVRTAGEPRRMGSSFSGAEKALKAAGTGVVAEHVDLAGPVNAQEVKRGDVVAEVVDRQPGVRSETHPYRVQASVHAGRCHVVGLSGLTYEGECGVFWHGELVLVGAVLVPSFAHPCHGVSQVMV